MTFQVKVIERKEKTVLMKWYADLIFLSICRRTAAGDICHPGKPPRSRILLPDDRKGSCQGGVCSP